MLLLVPGLVTETPRWLLVQGGRRQNRFYYNYFIFIICYVSPQGLALLAGARATNNLPELPNTATANKEGKEDKNKQKTKQM